MSKSVIKVLFYFLLGIVISLLIYINSYPNIKVIRFDSYHISKTESLSPSVSKGDSLNTNLEIINYCDPLLISTLNNIEDKFICYRGPLLIKEKGLEIDLATRKVLFIEGGKIIKIRELLYQSPENKWFQSPTGFFRIKTREKLHFSTIGLVWMPYSMQYYEDFFLHGIPYKDNGERINSTVSGGCLRFDDEVAKEIYEFVKINDPVLVYLSLNNYKIKDGFYSPLNKEESFVFQRFYNPIRITRYFSGDRDNLMYDYYNHTGLDIKLKQEAVDKNVYAIKEGKIIKIVKNQKGDYGMGNTIIIEHNIEGEKIYSLYAHLEFIRDDLQEGVEVRGGEVIGQVGATGDGCKYYWRLENNSCFSESPVNEHLHLEIKKAPVLYNPLGGQRCLNKKKNNSDYCYGAAPHSLFDKGYLNPLNFLYEGQS